MPGQLNPRQELDGVLDRQGVGSGYRSQLLGNLEDWAAGIARAGLDKELDGLYARLRDAEDARKAAVAVIQRQNKAVARVRAVHLEYAGDHTCYVDGEPYPCPTVQALDA